MKHLGLSGGVTPSLGSEGGTRFNGMGRTFEDHHKHWSAQQMMLHGMVVVVGCAAFLQVHLESAQSFPAHSRGNASQRKGEGTEHKCGSSVIQHKGKLSACTQQGKLCHGYNC